MTPEFQKEFDSALLKHSPEEWSSLQRWEMQAKLQLEVSELKRAMWLNDLGGEHGILREAVHVQVVAQRIIDEMSRRRNGCT